MDNSYVVGAAFGILGLSTVVAGQCQCGDDNCID